MTSRTTKKMYNNLKAILYGWNKRQADQRVQRVREECYTHMANRFWTVVVFSGEMLAFSTNDIRMIVCHLKKDRGQKGMKVQFINVNLR